MSIPAYDYILKVLQTTSREAKQNSDQEFVATYQSGEVYRRMRELIIAELEGDK